MSKLSKKIKQMPLPDGLADHPRAAGITQIAIPAAAVAGRDGAPEPQSAGVWAFRLPDGVAALPADLRAGVLRYADLVEAVSGAGGAGIDPTGVRASGGLPAGPSLSRLQSAEQLRRLEQRLSAVAPLRITAGRSAAARRRGAVVAAASARDVLFWLAVEGLSVANILRRAGVASPNRSHSVPLRDVILAAARAVSV